jgi:hypothetical protein
MIYYHDARHAKTLGFNNSSLHAFPGTEDGILTLFARLTHTSASSTATAIMQIIVAYTGYRYEFLRSV